MEGCRETVRVNGLDACYIRPLVFLGHGPLGVYAKNVPTEVVIAAYPVGRVPRRGRAQKGIRTTISSWIRLHHSSFPTTAKGAGQYLNSTLAVREAREKGFEEAILLDSTATSPRARARTCSCPQTASCRRRASSRRSCPGITRDSVITLAKETGSPSRCAASRAASSTAPTQLFFTGTAAEVSPIREVDDYAIGAGDRGPMTEKLQSAYFRAVKGEDPSKMGWLTLCA